MRFFLLAFFCTVLSSSSFSQKKEDDFSVRQREQIELEYEATLYDAFSQKVKGNINESMDLYLKCLKINPTSSACMYELAQLFFLANDLQASINLMEKAYNLNPLNEFYGLFLLDLYKQKKLYDKCIELSYQIIKRNPSNEINYYELALLYAATNKKKKALAVFNTIEKTFGFSDELYEQKFKMFVQFNDFKSASLVLQKLIEKYPDEESYYSDLFTLSKEIRDFDFSITVAEKYLKLNPASETVNVDLFDLYYQKRDTVKTIHQLKTIVSNHSFDVQNKFKLLYVFFKDNVFKVDTNLAGELTRLFVNANPAAYQSHMARAEYFYSLNKHDSAKSEYLKVYAIDKTIPTTYDRLIELEVKDDNWQQVYDICKNGLIFFPSNAYFFFYSGLSSYQLAKYDESINNFLSGLPYVTSNELRSQLYMYLAESYYKTKDFSKCYYFFDKSISFDQTNSMALNNYSYYLSLSQDSLPKALQMTILSNKLSPKNYIYLDTYAWVLFKMKNYEEAYQKICDAYSNGGQSTGEIVEHYGDILYKLGKTSEAVDMWNNAKKLDYKSDYLDQKILNKSYIE